MISTAKSLNIYNTERVICIEARIEVMRMTKKKQVSVQRNKEWRLRTGVPPFSFLLFKRKKINIY